MLLLNVGEIKMLFFWSIFILWLLRSLQHGIIIGIPTVKASLIRAEGVSSLLVDDECERLGHGFFGRERRITTI
jgi:hypothetical protein